jgi:hypothetical protein
MFFTDSATCARLQNRGGWAEDRALRRCGFPIGPRNTWSNAAYVAAGFALLWADRTPPTVVMCAALVMLGIGSGLYHGAKTKWANKLDHVGMYLVFGGLVAHGVDPAHPYTPALMLVTGVLLAGLFSYTGIKVSLDIQMGLLLYLSSLPGVLLGNWAELAWGYGLFLTAFLAWHLDLRRSKLVGLWGHAVWHVLTALAIGAIYLSQSVSP